MQSQVLSDECGAGSLLLVPFQPFLKRKRWEGKVFDGRGDVQKEKISYLYASPLPSSNQICCTGF